MTGHIKVKEEEMRARGEDWYVGEYMNESGAKQQGLFPQKWVEKYEPEPEPLPSIPPRSSTPKVRPGRNRIKDDNRQRLVTAFPSFQPSFKVKAVQEYASGRDEDLNFPVGQIIKVTENITVTEKEKEDGDEDWYVGEYTNENGVKQHGLFPQKFVEDYELKLLPFIPPRSSTPETSERDPQSRADIDPNLEIGPLPTPPPRSSTSETSERASLLPDASRSNEPKARPGQTIDRTPAYFQAIARVFESELASASNSNSTTPPKSSTPETSEPAVSGPQSRADNSLIPEIDPISPLPPRSSASEAQPDQNITKTPACFQAIARVFESELESTSSSSSPSESNTPKTSENGSTGSSSPSSGNSTPKTSERAESRPQSRADSLFSDYDLFPPTPPRSSTPETSQQAESGPKSPADNFTILDIDYSLRPPPAQSEKPDNESDRSSITLARAEDLCAMCNNPGSLCAQCHGIRYCSKACQEVDWPLHKLLCKSFNSFPSSKRPTPKFQRCIWFPEKGPQPRWVWVRFKAEDEPDLELLRYSKEQVKLMRETNKWDVNLILKRDCQAIRLLCCLSDTTPNMVKIWQQFGVRNKSVRKVDPELGGIEGIGLILGVPGPLLA